ncbi:MAG TPA: DALR domain-containing protein, partial [Burkholderiaceae bacterium]|nr:DALR domain-containing protein [Burkholderiaceae bacterium]
PNPREAEMLRFFIVRNHYRSVQNYTPDNLVDAQHALDRLYQALANVPPHDVEIDWEAEYCREFRDAMNDDFNSAGAVAVLFELASEANRSQSPQVSGLLKALGGVLGLLQSDPQTYLKSPSRYLGQPAAGAAGLSNEEIEAMIEARAQAKQRRDFSEADRLRDALNQAGVELEDRPGGVTQWRRA